MLTLFGVQVLKGRVLSTGQQAMLNSPKALQFITNITQARIQVGHSQLEYCQISPKGSHWGLQISGRLQQIVLIGNVLQMATNTAVGRTL
jgi:hypothetical protein